MQTEARGRQNGRPEWRARRSNRDRASSTKPNKAFAKNQTKRGGKRMEIGGAEAGKRKSEIESYCAMQMQGALGITTCMRSQSTIATLDEKTNT